MGTMINRRRVCGGDKTLSYAVDMGLPSGTLWATRNIDVTQPDGFAASPYQYECSFFSWGNVDGHNLDSRNKFDITWDAETYANTDGDELEGNIPLSQDAARVHCGAPWRMPTVEEQNELLANVIYVNADGVEIEGNAKGTTVNGINGVYMKSKINGNLLFIPFAGIGLSNADKGSRFRLWSSTIHASDNNKGKQIESHTSVIPKTNYDNGFRYSGASIRPVMSVIQ